jgi:3-methyladenine DNA glycosylase AlkD
VSKTEAILERVRADLQAHVDEHTRQSFQRFFKETVKAYGVKTGTVHVIATRFLPEVKTLSKRDFFSLCERLYASHYTEESFVASILLPHFIRDFKWSDLPCFKHWIDSYLDNWAAVDSFCNHTMGDFIEKYPKAIQELKKWTTSPNRWLRRAAAVSLIIPAKKGRYLPEAFLLADRLLLDPEDMVQKGYGWLLKEESRTHPDEVLQFILDRKDRMPRTALRYAIELLPPSMKTQAMKKA